MLNNQMYIYDKIQQEITPHYKNSIIVLKGKAGVGKTYIIEELITNINQDYNHPPICYIKGDQIGQKRDYYCIKQALAEVSVDYEKKKNDKALISELAQELPYAGDISKKIVSDKLNANEISQKRKMFFVDNADEENIIYRFNYLFDKKYSVMICDNFQYFDDKSLELIYLIINSEKALEFMKNCQIVIVLTEERRRNSIIDKIITMFNIKSFELKGIKYEELDKYLRKSGLKTDIDEKIKKVLFNLSKGHLEVIKQIAKKMNSQDYSSKLQTKKSENVLDELISENLDQMGSNGVKLSELLEYASLIGKSFSNYELEVSNSIQKQKFYELMDYSKKMELIIWGRRYSDFSHDIIQDVFFHRAYKNNYKYYECMRNCVKELYPSDYSRRIEIALQLERTEEAARLIVSLSIKNNFENVLTNKIYDDVIRNHPDIEEFYIQMKKAFEAYSSKNYIETIKYLSSIEDFYSVELLAERDILKSISLTKLINEKYRQEAISCLKEYTLDNLNHEGDIYLRILLSLISSYSHNGQIVAAKTCEKKINEYLRSRLSYDENARILQNILRRKANCIHECIFAEKMIKQSVTFFSPLPGNNMPFHPIHYLMSLGNHAGVLIECGAFKEALKEIEKAYKVIQYDRKTIFPRLQIIDNNFLLAAYLENPSIKDKILESYKKLVDLSKNADNILITSNYCSFLAINGYCESAYKILVNNQKKIDNNNESFYEISVDNNILILELYNKNFEKAQVILNRLKCAVNGIIDESYYRKKYELIQEVIDNKIDIPLNKIDTFLYDLCDEYQDAWAYWGHSFNFTALYYWSDL